MIDQPVDPGAKANRLSRHWAWFVGILSVLFILGFGLAVIAMLPLGMATDGCHQGDEEGVCALTATGQNILVFIPWIAMAAGTVVAAVVAFVAAKYRRSPLIGLLAGIFAYCAAIPLSYQIAFWF